MKVEEFARRLGINKCLEISPEMLLPEERIRAFCIENRCGNYGVNYTCPPYSGSLEEIKARIGQFRHGLLLQYSKKIDVKGDREGVVRTKMDFHNKILEIEEFLVRNGINRVLGMIGGNCGLCNPCKAMSNEPCPFPDRARISLESAGIDVIGLLDKLDLDNKFRPDRITWTGCVLFWSAPS